MPGQNTGIFGEWHSGEIDPGFRFFKIMQEDPQDPTKQVQVGEVVVDFSKARYGTATQYWYLYDSYVYPRPAAPNASPPLAATPAITIVPGHWVSLTSGFDPANHSITLIGQGKGHKRQTIVIQSSFQ